MVRKKKKAEDQKSWHKMYVYDADIFDDLQDAVYEFIVENEHAGNKASCGEISVDTVEDMEAWRKKRKELLLKDFCEYYMNAY